MAFVIMVKPPVSSARLPGLLHIDGQVATWGDDRRAQADNQASESASRYTGDGWQFAVMLEGEALAALRVARGN